MVGSRSQGEGVSVKVKKRKFEAEIQEVSHGGEWRGPGNQVATEKIRQEPQKDEEGVMVGSRSQVKNIVTTGRNFTAEISQCSYDIGI